MTEAPTSQDQEQFSKLKDQLTQRLLEDTEVLNFFGLDKDKVKKWTSELLFDDREIRVSPGFMSAGYGHNQSTQPTIAETDISSSVENYLHESRHGLHNLVCQVLFESNDALKNLKLFKENVLGDAPFVEQIERPGGLPLQEKMLKAVKDLAAKENATKEDVHKIAWMLGALTYQHAYYVDPGMCEAAASFHDTGITLFVDEYNQWFAKLLIPGEQFFEGYANRNWQEKFKKADPEHKALLVKKGDYKKEEYFVVK